MICPPCLPKARHPGGPGSGCSPAWSATGLPRLVLVFVVGSLQTPRTHESPPGAPLAAQSIAFGALQLMPEGEQSLAVACGPPPHPSRAATKVPLRRANSAAPPPLTARHESPRDHSQRSVFSGISLHLNPGGCLTAPLCCLLPLPCDKLISRLGPGRRPRFLGSRDRFAASFRGAHSRCVDGLGVRPCSRSGYAMPGLSL